MLDNKIIGTIINNAFWFFMFSFNILIVINIIGISNNNADIPINFDSTDSFQDYLNDWLKKSKYNFNTNVDVNHNVLTLCTCDNSSSYRIIIHAKLVQVH